MKTPFLLPALGMIFFPLLARADHNPDFKDDAKPILDQQPGLVHYVDSHFEVKDSGVAKFPGDEDHRARPPYIFSARPRGSEGAYNLRLLIQPGGIDHILRVVDITKVHFNDAPSSPVAGQPAPASAPTLEPATGALAPAAAATTPAPASSAEPTADTPSGPIGGTGTTTPSLEPPPDPTPGH